MHLRAPPGAQPRPRRWRPAPGQSAWPGGERGGRTTSAAARRTRPPAAAGEAGAQRGKGGGAQGCVEWGHTPTWSVCASHCSSTHRRRRPNAQSATHQRAQVGQLGDDGGREGQHPRIIEVQTGEPWARRVAGGQVGGEGWPARGGHRGDPPTAPVRRVSHTGSVRMYVDVLAAATLSLARLVSAEMAIGTASSLLSSNEAST